MRFVVLAAAAALCLSGAAYAGANGYLKDGAVALNVADREDCDSHHADDVADHDIDIDIDDADVADAVERALKEAYASLDEAALNDPELEARIQERVQAAVERMEARIEAMHDARREAREAQFEEIDARIEEAMQRVEEALERQAEADSHLTAAEQARINAQIEQAIMRAQAAVERASGRSGQPRWRRSSTHELEGGPSGGVL